MGELEVYVGDGKTSNEACYAALELALQLANEHRIRRIVLETNSELIVKQVWIRISRLSACLDVPCVEEGRDAGLQARR